MATAEQQAKKTLIAVIGDEDTITGMLLAGTGQINHANQSKNFLVVNASTKDSEIESAFKEFTEVRDDIAILLINQHLAEKIRFTVDTFTQAFPAVLEIPSKDHPYDPEKDSILRRVRRLFGE